MLTTSIKKPGYNNSSFISNSSIEQLKLLLQLYFKRTFQSNDKSVRFSGLFITNTEFEIRSKWEMSFGNKPYKSQPFVYGTLTPIDSKTTQVQLLVRHKVFKPYMILPLLLPIYLIVSGLFVKNNIDTVIVGAITLLFLSAFYFFAFNVSYNTLISDLKAELKLEQLPNSK